MSRAEWPDRKPETDSDPDSRQHEKEAAHDQTGNVTRWIRLAEKLLRKKDPEKPA